MSRLDSASVCFQAFAPKWYEGDIRCWAAPSEYKPEDRFFIKKSFDCSDIKFLKNELKKVVKSVGLLVVDSEDPSVFSAILPDEPDSKDGDFVQVKLSWSIDQPGKRIDTSVS